MSATNATSQFASEIQTIAQRLSTAKDVFVVTGAGMSADSGLPTYRGIGGLYEDKDTEDGIPIEQALSGPVFQRTPEITWKYLSQIEQGTRGATHNRGHEVLAAMEKAIDRFWILTQNIDGLHTSAGSKNVIEIHGNMHILDCMSCPHSYYVEDFSGMSIPPTCPECSEAMRPAVVLFEEQLPGKAIEELSRQIERPFDVVISIGTSSCFPYITQPIYYGKQQGALTVEINPADTPVSDVVDIKLPLGAAEVLDLIWNKVQTI